MSLPFRIRRVEWIAGALLMLAVVAMVGSLVLLSRGRGSFESTVPYHVILDNGYGITAGGKVEMLGIDIGRIESIEITDDNHVAAQLRIRERFTDRVREDSRARVKASLDLQGVLGGVGLSITPGEGVVLPPDGEITVVEPNSFADLLPSVPGDTLVADLEALIHNARELSDTFADPESPLRDMLEQTTALLAKVQDGKSTIGRVLADDGEIYDRLLGTLDDVEQSLDRLQKVLGRSGALIHSADALLDRGDVMMDEAGNLIGEGGKVVAGIGPVLEDTDIAMKHLDESVRAFHETTHELEAAIKALGPVIEGMDEMVRDMDEVAEAAKKIFPIRRHVRRQDRKKK